MSRKRSGQIAVTTAGTAVVGTTVQGTLFALQADPANTGEIWVGNDGANDISVSEGFPLNAAGPGIILAVNNLNELWFDASVSGEIVCWLLITE